MRCVICKNGETHPGKTTVTLERDGMTLIVRSVPPEICDNCGEEYVDSTSSVRLLETAEEAARTGAHLDVREFAA